MDSDDISSLAKPPSHMLEVKCRARFPKNLIQRFGPGSVGRFTLTLDSRREILRANARLYDAAYTHLIIDDPVILEAFSDGCDCKQELSFPPLMKFRLDAFDNPDLDSEASGHDAARLVNITNLPAMVAFGRRPIQSLEPPKGAVHARLEAVWGKDVGHPVAKRKLIETESESEEDHLPEGRTKSAQNSPLSQTFMGSTENIDQSEQRDRSQEKIHLKIVKNLSEANSSSQPTSSLHSKRFESAQRERSVGFDSESSSAIIKSTASDSNSSAPEHQCRNRIKCTICRTTPSHPWLSSDAHGIEMAKILSQINSRMPEDAQFEYGRLFNLERRRVAKKSKVVKNEFRKSLQDFAVRYDIVVLHNQFATLQRKEEKHDYRLPLLELHGEVAFTFREESAASSKTMDEANVQEAPYIASQHKYIPRSVLKSPRTKGMSNSSD